MIAWEYKTEYWVWGRAAVGFTRRTFEEKLNAAGAEGWELVTVLNTHLGDGRPEGPMAVFKRPRNVAGPIPPPIPGR